MMVKFLASLLCSGLLLGGHVVAQFVKDPTNSVSNNVARQFVDKEAADQRGFRVVIVYETPKNCPAVNRKFENTDTEIAYVTHTSTTDIYVTRMPESCPEKHCEPIVEKQWVTKTYSYPDSAQAHNKAGSHSGGNSGERYEDYAESNARVEVFGDTSFGKRPSKPGLKALRLIGNIGEAYTSTILTDGPTTSMEYVRKPAKLETKPDPILVLRDLNGPNTISIDYGWSLSLSFELSDAQVTGYDNRALPPGADVFETTDADGIIETKTTGLGLSSATALASTSGMSLYWNQSMSASTTSFVPSTNVSLSQSSSQSLMVNKTSELSALQTMVIKHERTCFEPVNLFEKISDINPGQFLFSRDHELPVPEGISHEKPFQTNKFYSNLFLGKQSETVFTYPYEVYWEHTSYHGMAIQYPDPKRRVFGGSGINGAKQYYYNGIRSPGFFATATKIVQNNNYMSLSQMSELSVNVKLSATPEDTKDYIEFPLVEGMGVVTSIYHGNLVPKILGNGGIGSLYEVIYNTTSTHLQQNTKQYRVEVSNGEKWLVMVTIPGKQKDFKLELKDGNLVGSDAIDGLIIQYALAPYEPKSIEDQKLSEKVFYGIAGRYLTDAKVSGELNCAKATYRIKYSSEGESRLPNSLVYTFPHHYDALDSETRDKEVGIQVPSTTKGFMTGFLTDELGFVDVIDGNISWLPYVKKYNPDLTYTNEQIKLIRQAAVDELKDVDIDKVLSEIPSQYFMGKALDKYAYLMYVLHDIVGDEELAGEVLATLKKFYDKYKTGVKKPSLYYDTKFKGVTSEERSIPLDFGSGDYNDHNFHYAYTIHTAAMIGYLDSKKSGTWVAENKDFVDALVRDVANPSEDDKFFPVSRSFDWYQGHSWAKGVFESQDGKDQESSSEDVNFSYAMKMWGKVSGDKSMEARASLMLKIQERAFNLYFLYKDDNDVVPKEILNNKVSGIFFENKVDYTVYFAEAERKVEYNHGIQMLPMTPGLGSVRSSVFAEQEWNQILKDADAKGGWAGILNSNRVFFDPSASWKFFAKPDFDMTLLDGGQSRAWALAYAAPFKNEAAGLR